jgi:hypothetical protein
LEGAGMELLEETTFHFARKASPISISKNKKSIFVFCCCVVNTRFEIGIEYPSLDLSILSDKLL